MCDFDNSLIAWMDGELDGPDAATVEQHVSACDECRARLAAYENASRDFAAYYAATTQTPVANGPNSAGRLIPYLVTAAAAIIVALILLPRAHRQTQFAAQPDTVKAAPPVAVEPAATSVPFAAVPQPVQRRTALHRVPQNATQPPSEPVVQIVIPADAVFPPGAMPDGVAYVANLNYTIGGALPGYRLQQ